ncbi:3-phosphoshikimate 1-carboxyvinyltransferase [Paenibacillus ginsengarvi]|uniref:3-phosphoshikimate 1-carboxyvinyltransferase n=1 Tax=Paenibacillus ginsengarvi TaxID=400777 RepID=A0A3B0CKB6_9BACL|nr:3-phosphoshikimate 1-carboxyvinyltransferase [Paenibacillus ginsengarvi]RKN85271.1 3-phosphoshikimate 1-carboxyvinyltransferase [Paenibacillus ginsengarvi]
MFVTEPDLEARSPWSQLHTIAEAELAPPSGPPQQAVIHAPGSKSVSNRVLIMAAMARGRSVIGNLLRSDDTYWCIDALRRLGVPVSVADEAVTVDGIGGHAPVREGSLYMGAAGTAARFLPGLLAACPEGRWRLEGSASLSARPIGPLIEALRAAGADIRYEGREGRLPIVINAAGLRGGTVELAGDVSSQFISGLLMAGAYAANPLELVVPGGIVQHAYVGITVDWMRRFGAQVTHSDMYDRFEVIPGPYAGHELKVEADASTACYYLAFAALTGGHVHIPNLRADTRQPDIAFTDILQRMGCRIAKGPRGVELWGPERLRGGFTVSMKELSDQTLTLAAIAPFADAPITITDVAHIRHHECDRIAAICESLGQLGIAVEEHADGLTVFPGTPSGGLLPTYDDHRVAMSLALIAAKVPGIRLLDPGCVSKTCPPFFDHMRSLGMRVRLKPKEGQADAADS